jgi:hypothetical protein
MKPVLSLQIPGSSGRYEDFHRVECKSKAAADVRAALEKILKEPVTTRIGNNKAKPSYQRVRKLAALKKDEEVLPGVEVDAKVAEAMAGV